MHGQNHFKFVCFTITENCPAYRESNVWNIKLMQMRKVCEEPKRGLLQASGIVLSPPATYASQCSPF